MSGASVVLVKDSAGTALTQLKADSSGRLEVHSTAASGVTQDVDIVAQSVGTLAVGDSTAQSTLSSISGKLPATLGQDIMNDSLSVTIASNQSAVSVSDSSAQSTLASIDGKTPSLGQAGKSASVPVVIASDQGALAVTVSGGGLTTTSTAVFSSQSVSGSSSALSTSVDLGAIDASITISGVFTDTSGSVEILVSSDDTTYYELTSAFVNLDFSTGNFGVTLPGLGERYIKLRAVNSLGSSQTITARIAYKS
jgi:hypothetical protein